MELNPRWQVSVWEGSYELPLQRALETLLRPGGVCYDVGAGAGFYTLALAKRGARVFAFEPDVTTAGILERHVAWNGLADSVVVVQNAVHSFTGEIGLIPADQSGHPGNALVRSIDQAPQRVQCVTLDQFAKEHDLPHIVKIDVEGNEHEVLRGANEVFATAKPTLLCEVHDAKNRDFLDKWSVRNSYGLDKLGPDNGAFPMHFLGRPRPSI